MFRNLIKKIKNIKLLILSTTALCNLIVAGFEKNAKTFYFKTSRQLLPALVTWNAISIDINALVINTLLRPLNYKSLVYCSKEQTISLKNKIIDQFFCQKKDMVCSAPVKRRYYVLFIWILSILCMFLMSSNNIVIKKSVGF